MCFPVLSLLLLLIVIPCAAQPGLDIRGLHLGISIEDLRTLTGGSGWGLNPDQSFDKFDTNGPVFLRIDSSAADSFRFISCRPGPDFSACAG